MKSLGKYLTIMAATTAIFSAIAWTVPTWYVNNTVENDLIRMLKKRLNEFNDERPEDRVYLQTDKPMYEPGDDIWFAAYVRNGSDLKASDQSDIVHVELINPKGSVEKTLNLVALKGKTAGDFNLPETAPGGIYKIKGYTNWQKNDSTFFEKEFQVQKVVLPRLKMKLDFERKAFGPGDEVFAKIKLETNENEPLANHKINYVAQLDGKKIAGKELETDETGERYVRFNLPKDLSTNDGLLNIMISYQGNTESISRSIPIVLNKIDLAFYPEGGEMINQMENRVAFKAMNEFGKPADIEGEVLDKDGKVVAEFNSYHMGMGAFDFIPEEGQSYTARITKPAGVDKKYELPEALPVGYTISVDNSNKDMIKVKVISSEEEELSLLAQVRGKLCYSTAINAKAGYNVVKIPAKKFPMGVAQFTLFDHKGIARAERLAFVNKDQQLQVSIKTDKEKYLPREKVNMTITVKDDRGLPMPGSFSLAVTNDQLLSFADDKQGNILSQMLLEQDLKQKVEEPNFYFDPKEEKADEALDYLLMTSGWRRFEWQKVAWSQVPRVMFQGEKAVVSGKILDAYTRKPIKKASLKINDKYTVKADENGVFSLKGVDLSEKCSLYFTADGYGNSSRFISRYQDNLMVYMYPQNYGTYTVNATRAQIQMDEVMLAPAAAKHVELAAVEVMEVQKRHRKKEGRAERRNEPRDKNKEQLAVPMEEPVGGAKVAEKKDKAEEAEEKDVDNFKQLAAGIAMDDRWAMDEEFAGEDIRDLQGNNQQQAQVYYRARTFAAPVYDQAQNVEMRTDFRNTIYWNPNVEVGTNGKAKVSFYTSDDITSFRAVLEGIGFDGSVAHSEKTIYSQLPFAMQVKTPVEVATEDVISIPLTLTNNTDHMLEGKLNITAPNSLIPVSNISEIQKIAAGESKTIFLDYSVSTEIGAGDFNVSFNANGLSDAFSQQIKTVAKGFPVTASFSGNDLQSTFTVNPQNVVKGSMQATFIAYPNVVSDLMQGVSSILREPYGCFEQTSMSSYPNAMVLDYLKATESSDDKLLASATGLLDRGYKRLTTFETKEKGYEWFGSNPGHEALTAYGLMQFNDMKKVGGKVDEKMLKRTANWLLSRKNGKGGFKRNERALDNFGRASKEVTDAYIVYALSEAGFSSEIQNEFAAAYNNAMKSKDPYMLAMVANAAYNLNATDKGNKALTEMMKHQEEDGNITGANHSITYSTGKSLIIETTSLGLIAMLKAPDQNLKAINKAVEALVNNRSGYGGFGNTQGTVLSLKALTEFAKFSKKTNEDGIIEIYVDGKKVAEKEYKAGDKGAIEISGLEAFLSSGKQDISVKFQGAKEALPYSMAVTWNTFLPNSDDACAVQLKTKLNTKTAKVGETVRLSATLTNTKDEGIPSTMAIIGVPAGFTLQPWQLKELQEKGVFDYYEIKGNNLAVYYRCMAPSAVKEINLDLKAEMPGTFDAPASSAYLYYTNEHKCWTGLGQITVKKNKM